MEDITPEDSVVPVYRVELSEDEITTMQKAELEMIRQEEERLEKENARQSAIEKLSKLGLTEEEAKAVIGI